MEIPPETGDDLNKPDTNMETQPDSISSPSAVLFITHSVAYVVAGQNSAASSTKAREWHSSQLPLLSTPPSMTHLHHCPLFDPFLPSLFKPQTSRPITSPSSTPKERGSERHQDFSPFSVLFAFDGINYLTISIHQRSTVQRQNPNKRRTLKLRTW